MNSLYQRALAAIDKYTQHSSGRSAPLLSSHVYPQHGRFSCANEDGELAESSSNTPRAYICAGVGSLASDVAQLARAALARANVACRSLGRRKPASDEVLVLSQDTRGVPSLRASTEIARQKDSVLHSAQQHFHAAMKATGLETGDQSSCKNLKRISCRSRSGSLGLTPQASQALADTDAAAHVALEDSDDSAKLVLQAIQYAVESAYSGSAAVPRFTVQDAEAEKALQDAQSIGASHSAAIACTLQDQSVTAQQAEAASRITHAPGSAVLPCASVTSQPQVPTSQYTAGSNTSSPHCAAMDHLHKESLHGYTASAQSQPEAGCAISSAADVRSSSSSASAACSSNTDQQHDGSGALSSKQFARESEDLDDPGSTPRIAAMEACNAALGGRLRLPYCI